MQMLQVRWQLAVNTRMAGAPAGLSSIGSRQRDIPNSAVLGFSFQCMVAPWLVPVQKGD
jgi:hypothetical protein